MVSLVEKKDVDPICPHCKKDLKEIYYRELSRDLGRRIVYYCSQCRGCLGFSHRKGLTMGL